jgi:hypothetical protein
MPVKAKVGYLRGQTGRGSSKRLLTQGRGFRHHGRRTMLLNHVLSYRLWQRDFALLAMTRVIVKGARESVRDR